MQAYHEAITDREGLVHQWRVTQLTRLGIPGPLAQAGADRVGVLPGAIPQALPSPARVRRTSSEGVTSAA